MRLVLIGIQGAGKSTQGNMLSKQLHIPYLSTGHIFREIAKEKTKLGRYVKELMQAGTLIPDDKTIEIVNSYLSRPEYKNGYILDGFPRTLKQAKEFVNHVDRVVELRINDKEALWRLAYRREERDDNTIQAIRNRIEMFHTHTKPVLGYYKKQGKLITLDGAKPIQEVNEEILKNLGKQLVKNHIHEWSKKQKSILAIVGMPGSGKTEATEFFKEKGLKVISFSKIINEYIDKNKLKHTNEVHSKLRKEFREKHGFEAMAALNKEKLEEALNDKENMMIVIEGMRSWEEYTFLKKTFPEVSISILCMYASKKNRYKRISHRKDRSRLFGEERDIDELIGTNMGATIAFSDFLVVNETTLDDLYEELEEVYRIVYFT